MPEQSRKACVMVNCNMPTPSPHNEMTDPKEDIIMDSSNMVREVLSYTVNNYIVRS